MTQAEIEAEARMVALEYMWAHTHTMVCRMLKADEATIERAETEARKNISMNTVAGISPEMSDHLSAEILDAIERLWRGAREMREAGRT